MTNTYDREIDRLEQMIDSIGGDFGPIDLAHCVHGAFTTGELQTVLEREKLLKIYHAIMFRIYARILGTCCLETYVPWIKQNGYGLTDTMESKSEKRTTQQHAIAA